jgi:hypothetical protein
VTGSARLDVGLAAELDRQRDVLLERGYPALAGLDEGAFVALVEPLRAALAALSPAPPGGVQADRHSRVPFVLVASERLAAAESLVPGVRLATGRPGVLDRNHGTAGLTPYRPIDAVAVPPARLYLLLDVERGEEFCGIPPEQALPVVLGRGRTPLTIHEGIALVTLRPDVLERNRCFMLAGSRRGDRRVPALWISAGAAKLGWCWEGNPHSWLGTASAARRVAAESGA